MEAPVLLPAEEDFQKEERKPSVGAYLQQERIRKNISLLDVSKVTRISLQYLEALETDQFQILPGPVFARGFLRTYATNIGLDPKEVMEMYEAQMTSLVAEKKMESVPSPKGAKPLTKYILFLCIIGVGVAIAFTFFFKKTPAPPSPPSSPEISLRETPLAKVPQPEALPRQESESAKALKARKLEKSPERLPGAGPVVSAGTTEEEKRKEKRHALKFEASETTWLRIQADDQPAVEALLQPKETATWTARRQFKITIGNAGGVELFLDGISQGPLGQSGQVIHLQLPKEITPPSEPNS